MPGDRTAAIGDQVHTHPQGLEAWDTVPGGPRRVGIGRLSRGEEIAAVRRGRPHHGRLVVVYVRPSERGTRAGFVCARAVGGAVQRNRARRLMREGARRLLPLLGRPHEVVFVARPEIRGAKAQDVTADMRGALRAAGVLES